MSGSSGLELKLISHLKQRSRHFLSSDIAQALALEQFGSEGTALETLTVREFEILRLLVEARSIEDIAQTLNISTKMVRNCHYLITTKLGVAGDIELMRLAIRLRVVDLLELSEESKRYMFPNHSHG